MKYLEIEEIVTKDLKEMFTRLPMLIRIPVEDEKEALDVATKYEKEFSDRKVEYTKKLHEHTHRVDTKDNLPCEVKDLKLVEIEDTKLIKEK